MAICNTEYPDVKKHDADLPDLEKDWPRFKENDKHGRLSQFPTYFRRSPSESLWSQEKCTTAEFSTRLKAAIEEGQNFKKVFLEDVQFVLSRTAHHHHKMTAKGRMPLNDCQKKGQKTICKHGFPKDQEMTVNREF